MGDGHKPVNIAKAAVEHAAKNGNNVVILDTAGRLHVDEDMMDELIEIKEMWMYADGSGSRCHDWSGCNQCSKKEFDEKLELME